MERKRKQARSRTRKRVRAKVLDDGPRDAKRARVSNPSQPIATRALPEDTEAGGEDSDGDDGQERQDWGAEACVEMSTSDESDSERRQGRRLVRATDMSDAKDEATRHDASDVDAKHADDAEGSGDDRTPTKAPRKARRQHRRKGGWSLDRRVLRMQDVLGDSLSAELRQRDDDTELNPSICCACLAGPHEVRNLRSTPSHAHCRSMLPHSRSSQAPCPTAHRSSVGFAGGAVSDGRGFGTQALFEHGRCHPELEVRLCVECHSRYEGDMKNAETGKDGKDDYCQLCSYGGDLLVCDDCPKAFCKVIAPAYAPIITRKPVMTAFRTPPAQLQSRVTAVGR